MLKYIAVSRDDEVLFSPDADFDTFREGNDSAWAGLIPGEIPWT